MKRGGEHRFASHKRVVCSAMLLSSVAFTKQPLLAADTVAPCPRVALYPKEVRSSAELEVSSIERDAKAREHASDLSNHVKRSGSARILHSEDTPM